MCCLEWFTVSPSISLGNVRKLDLVWANLWPETHLLLLKLSVMYEDHSLAKMLLRCFTDLPCQVLIGNILYVDKGTSFLISNTSCLMSVRVCVCTRQLSRVQLFVTPWTIALQGPLSMEFSKQEYWSVLPFSIPGDLPDRGIKPTLPVSPALQAILYPLSHSGSLVRPWGPWYVCIKNAGLDFLMWTWWLFIDQPEFSDLFHILGHTIINMTSLFFLVKFLQLFVLFRTHNKSGVGVMGRKVLKRYKATCSLTWILIWVEWPYRQVGGRVFKYQSYNSHPSND